MAVHAGVVYFDGRPIDLERRWVTASVQPIAPNGVSLFAQDGVVIAHGACHVWSGEAGVLQPLQSESGVFMAWDGRLDNRDDLALRLRGCLAGKMSDVEIALATFERWGIDGLGLLVGDWSTAIWDSARRTLHLARDYMGVRPLYYYVNQEAVMWSSSLGELATRSGRLGDLDEMFVTRFMALRSSTDVTPYAGIRAVPTATSVSIQNRQERRHRFWSLEPGRIRYRNNREYEEHFRSLWVEAVGRRLRCARTVWAELSGGLDSSSVVCMADALTRASQVDAAAVQPLSHVTFQSPEGDERRFIAAVEDKIGVCSDILGVEEHQDLRDAAWDWVTPRAVEGVQVASIRHVRDRGGRVVLSGRMGDLVMGCAPDNSAAVFDDFANGDLAIAVSNMRLWSRARRVPFIEVACELIAEAAHARLKQPSRPHASGTQIAGRALLVERLRRAAEEDGPCRDRGRRGIRLAQRQVHELILTVSRQAQLEVQSGAFDVTYTYPFSHRPLVEFVLAIPGEQLSAPGQLRSLMRRALVELVPPKVLQRISKGYYPPAVMRATRSIVASWPHVDRIGVVRRGWLDSTRLEAAIRALVDGAPGTSSELQRVIRLEQWLQSRDRWGPTAMPQRKEVTTNEVLIA